MGRDRLQAELLGAAVGGANGEGLLGDGAVDARELVAGEGVAQHRALRRPHELRARHLRLDLRVVQVRVQPSENQTDQWWGNSGRWDM